MRILKGSTYIYVCPVVTADDGETPADATAPPTVSVTRDDGTVLTAPTVTHVTDSTALGQYQAVFTAAVHTVQCDRLVVVTTATTSGALTPQVTTDIVEVVGAHYVTIAQIRNEPGMSDSNVYPTSLLVDLREEFEALVEGIIGYSLVRRYQRDQLESRLTLAANLDGMYGPDPLELVLTKPYPQTVLSVKFNGTTQATSGFTVYPWGKIRSNLMAFPPRTPSTGGRNIVIGYEHGQDLPPADLRRECLRWIRRTAKTRQSQTSPNLTGQTLPGGTTNSFVLPDPKNGRPTGIVTLDPILDRLSLQSPGIG